MEKLICVIMGEDHRDFLEIALESAQGADAIIYCDGGSSDDSQKLAYSYGATVLFNEFDQEDPQANGKQRNFYLEYLKKHHLNSWCLAIDADEVIHDMNNIKRFVQTAPWVSHQDGKDIPVVYDVHMRHLIGDLTHEDNTRERHYCPHRLFKISQELEYPLGEHNVALTSKHGVLVDKCEATTIWHLAYSPMFHVRRRMRKNMKHSEVHSKEFLNQWYRAHLFSGYPRSSLHPKELPPALLKGFDLDPDEFYFHNRGLEVKHFIDAGHWRKHFQCADVLEFGCGRGPRVYAMRNAGIEAYGIELSQWAVDHSLVPGFVRQGDVAEKHILINRHYLVVAYDLLEHIPYEQLDDAIDNLIKYSRKHLLISVPVLGDPNLEADSTHLIKETKDWWKKQFLDKGCKEQPVPQHFLYKEQLMIFTVPEAQQ